MKAGKFYRFGFLCLLLVGSELGIITHFVFQLFYKPVSFFDLMNPSSFISLSFYFLVAHLVTCFFALFLLHYIIMRKEDSMLSVPVISSRNEL